VTLQLESAIGMGLLNPGERLPPESVMAEHLGVSPLTLRQSLAVLRSKGLLGTRRGRGGGSYVAGVLPVREAEIAEQLRRHKSDDLRDLIDLAAATAGSAARLTSKRSDEQDVRPSGSSPSASRQARSPTCFARPMPACTLGWGWRPSPAAYTLTWQSWPTQRRTFLRRQVRRGPNSSPSGRSSRTSSRGNRARWTAPACPSPPGCSATPTRGTSGGAWWAGSWCSR
jgi:DNA-binding transcriptional regulator YhcF (GntR family)